MDFPSIFTFKIIGENADAFMSGVDVIFAGYADRSIVPTNSSSGKFISLSVTIEVKDYEELKGLYEKISKLQGLRFYV